MQELRLVAVSEDGSYLVLATAGRGTRFTLPVDDRLRAVVRGHFSRLGQYEIEVESPLRPKEIQARIRAGETADEIAESAGIPVERVRWFEGPVLQEREYMAQQAQRVTVRRPGETTSGPALGEVVEERLGKRGIDLEDVEWDSWKCEDATWRVRLSFFVDARPSTAEWAYDPRRRHVSPLDDEAGRLSTDEFDETLADVTPFTPRRTMKVVPSPPVTGREQSPPRGPHTLSEDDRAPFVPVSAGFDRDAREAIRVATDRPEQQEQDQPPFEERRTQQRREEWREGVTEAVAEARERVEPARSTPNRPAPRTSERADTRWAEPQSDRHGRPPERTEPQSPRTAPPDPEQRWAEPGSERQEQQYQDEPQYSDAPQYQDDRRWAESDARPGRTAASGAGERDRFEPSRSQQQGARAPESQGVEAQFAEPRSTEPEPQSQRAGPRADDRRRTEFRPAQSDTAQSYAPEPRDAEARTDERPRPTEARHEQANEPRAHRAGSSETGAVESESAGAEEQWADAPDPRFQPPEPQARGTHADESRPAQAHGRLAESRTAASDVAEHTASQTRPAASEHAAPHTQAAAPGQEASQPDAAASPSRSTDSGTAETSHTRATDPGPAEPANPPANEHTAAQAVSATAAEPESSHNSPAAQPAASAAQATDAEYSEAPTTAAHPTGPAPAEPQQNRPRPGARRPVPSPPRSAPGQSRPAQPSRREREKPAEPEPEREVAAEQRTEPAPPQPLSRNPARTARQERPKHEEPVEEQIEEQPAAAAAGGAVTPPPTTAPEKRAGGRKKGSARGKRASVPSWDEIMFGTRRPE